MRLKAEAIERKEFQRELDEYCQESEMLKYWASIVLEAAVAIVALAAFLTLIFLIGA